MAAGLLVLFAGGVNFFLQDGVDNIQGTVSPVYSAPYGVNAAAFDAASQFLLKFQAYFPSADEGCFSVASGMDEQFHGKAVGKVNGGLFDFIRGNGDFQSVVLILKLFSNRSNNLLFSSYIQRGLNFRIRDYMTQGTFKGGDYEFMDGSSQVSGQTGANLIVA